MDERVDLRIGLGPRQVRIEIGQHNLGHLQTERAGNLARDELGDQCFRSLSGAAELQHIQPVIVCFDDRRKRTALPERSHIPGDVDGPECWHRVIVAWVTPARTIRLPAEAVESAIERRVVSRSKLGTQEPPCRSKTFLPKSLATLLHEVLEGPAATGAFVLNRGDRGLLGALDQLSAQQASARPTGRPSVAAHVEHLRYGLELLNKWVRGTDPWSTADYAASWQRDHVNDEQWKTLREALRDQAGAWIRATARRTDWSELATTEAFASVVHLAYHLGAIRQVAAGARGPRARD